MTEEQELLLDCWYQFATYTDPQGKTHYSNMCLSTLEALEGYLIDKDLIDPISKGPITKEASK